MQNFKSTPDNLKQIFKAFGRKPSLGAAQHCARVREWLSVDLHVIIVNFIIKINSEHSDVASIHKVAAYTRAYRATEKQAGELINIVFY